MKLPLNFTVQREKIEDVYGEERGDAGEIRCCNCWLLAKARVVLCGWREDVQGFYAFAYCERITFAHSPASPPAWVRSVRCRLSLIWYPFVVAVVVVRTGVSVCRNRGRGDRNKINIDIGKQGKQVRQEK